MWIDAKGSTVLPAPECLRLLALSAKAGGIGRLGVATDHAPVVIPINFTLRDGQVLVRVGNGFLTQAASGHLVAFETDHVGDRTAWSVLVRGLATLTEAPTESELSAAARPLVPEPGDMVLAIRPDVLSGRQFNLVSGPADRSAAKPAFSRSFVAGIAGTSDESRD